VTESALSPAARIAASYKALAASAQALNAASDELSKPIADVDAVLKQLNLGLTVWEKIQGLDEDGYGNFWSRDVGYAKVGGKWGIAIRTTEGNHNNDAFDDEEWLFDNAPRTYRIDAIEKIPELLDKLIKASDKTARKLKEKAVEARELATALTGAATDAKQQQKKERR
jgi:prefoldin subunit 5